MNNNDVTEFVIDCMTDAGNRDKQAALAQWLQESAENRALYAELKLLWEAAAGIPAMPFNVQEGWQQVSPDMMPRPETKRPASWRAMAAAIALLLTGGGIWWWLLSYNGGDIVYTARQIEKDSLALPDGTLVYLKPGTSLKYKRKFDKRAVALLKGEAYFTVAPDPERQFVVTTAAATVKVLGTAFNVRIDSTYTEVIVCEGKVSLNSQDKQLVLAAAGSNLGTAALDNGGLQHPRGNYTNRCVWATNELVFENEEAQHVADVVAEYYHQPRWNIAPQLQHKRITVRFSNTSYEEASQILRALIDE
jgi:transmembrane sensor